MDASQVDLLAQLRRFAATDRRSRLPAEPPTLSFVADEAERITGLRCVETSIIAVLEGRKDLWQGGREWACPAGSAVVLPRGWTGDVVNIPDGKSGFYRAVVLIFSDETLRDLAARATRSVGGARAATSCRSTASSARPCCVRWRACRLPRRPGASPITASPKSPCCSSSGAPSASKRRAAPSVRACAPWSAPGRTKPSAWPTPRSA